MNTFTLAALLGLTTQASELQDGLDCISAIIADEDNDSSLYGGPDNMVEVEACDTGVTSTTCYDAAMAIDGSASAGKMAVVLHEECEGAGVGVFYQCTYLQQVADAGDQVDDWDPRACPGDGEGAELYQLCSIMTWGASVDANAFLEDFDLETCNEEEDAEEDDEDDDEDDEDDEDASATLTAGFASLAMASLMAF